MKHFWTRRLAQWTDVTVFLLDLSAEPGVKSTPIKTQLQRDVGVDNTLTLKLEVLTQSPDPSLQSNTLGGPDLPGKHRVELRKRCSA